MTEEHRIKIAAAEWAYDKVDVSAYQGYIAGATAELERLKDTRLYSQEVIDSYEEQLKQERNKAIDEAIALLKDRGWSEDDYNGKILFRILSELKH